MAIDRISPEGLYQPWGDVYTQVIRAEGSTQIHVAGTVSLDENRELLGEDDMSEQTRVVFEHLGSSLAAAGAGPQDVVRINLFTRDVARFLEEGSRWMQEFFDGQPPASTLVGVTGLADPRYLIEIEVDAILD